MRLNFLNEIKKLIGINHEEFTLFYINNSEDLKKLDSNFDKSAFFINSTKTHFVNNAIKSIRLNRNIKIYLKTIVCRPEVEDYLFNPKLVDFYVSGKNLENIVSYSEKINYYLSKFQSNHSLNEEQIINIRILRWAYTRSQNNISYTLKEFYNNLIGSFLSLHFEGKSFVKMYMFLEKFKAHNYFKENKVLNLEHLMNFNNKNSFIFKSKAKNLIFNNYSNKLEIKSEILSKISKNFISNSYFNLLLLKGKYSESLNIKDGFLFKFELISQKSDLENSLNEYRNNIYNIVFDTLGNKLSENDYFTEINSQFYLVLSGKYSIKESEDLIKLIRIQILSEFDSNEIDLNLIVKKDEAEIKSDFLQSYYPSKEKLAS